MTMFVRGCCLSCGYPRKRPADAACAWPERHVDAAHPWRAEVIRRYLGGLSIHDVARVMGCDYNQAYGVLKDHNVDRRSVAEAVKPTSTWRIDRDGRCLSCGYMKNRPPDAACAWPDRHAPVDPALPAAAQHLRNPYLCNWDGKVAATLADWLDDPADPGRATAVARALLDSFGDQTQ